MRFELGFLRIQFGQAVFEDRCLRQFLVGAHQRLGCFAQALGELPLALGVFPTWTWLLFPFAVAFLFVLTAAISLALSALYVRFRDVAIIWVVIAQVLFYSTPILYSVDFKGEEFERLMMINPLAVIFEQARVWILAEPKAPSAVDAAHGWLGLIPAALIFAAICGFGIWVFNREAPRMAEDL